MEQATIVFIRGPLSAISSILAATACGAGEVSVKRGSQVAVTGGCHDCHTAGCSETGGDVELVAALKRTNLGRQGPWGATYPANLRITAQRPGNVDVFVQYAQTFAARPQIPSYNVHAMDEHDLRSLYQYIVSLGGVGSPALDYEPLGIEPRIPHVIITPSLMPKSREGRDCTAVDVPSVDVVYSIGCRALRRCLSHQLCTFGFMAR